VPCAGQGRTLRVQAPVAALSGLSAHTLRYYEPIALLDPVARVHGGQRRYDADDLAWLAFLQRLRPTGMPIRDMHRFAELRRRGEATAARHAATSWQRRSGTAFPSGEAEGDARDHITLPPIDR